MQDYILNFNGVEAMVEYHHFFLEFIKSGT